MNRPNDHFAIIRLNDVTDQLTIVANAIVGLQEEPPCWIIVKYHYISYVRSTRFLPRIFKYSIPINTCT